MTPTTLEKLFRWFAFAMSVIVPCGILYALFQEEEWPLGLRLFAGAATSASCVWTIVKLNAWWSR